MSPSDSSTLIRRLRQTRDTLMALRQAGVDACQSGDEEMMYGLVTDLSNANRQINTALGRLGVGEYKYLVSGAPDK